MLNDGVVGTRRGVRVGAFDRKSHRDDDNEMIFNQSVFVWREIYNYQKSAELSQMESWPFVVWSNLSVTYLPSFVHKKSFCIWWAVVSAIIFCGRFFLRRYLGTNQSLFSFYLFTSFSHVHPFRTRKKFFRHKHSLPANLFSLA